MKDDSYRGAEVEALAELARRLRAEVETAGFTGSPEEIREQLLELGREIESRIVALQEIRENLRPIAARYRAIYRAAGPERRDHLHAQTERERGWTALSGGEPAVALEHLRRALDLDPDDPDSQALLAWCRASLGELAVAEALVQELLRYHPAHAIGRVVAGLIEIGRRRFEAAVTPLAAVLDGGTGSTAGLYALLYLGVACAGMGRLAEARAHFRRALEEAPNLTEAYWHLGHCYHADGRLDLAREVWRVGGENRFSGWGERCRVAASRQAEALSPEPG